MISLLVFRLSAMGDVALLLPVLKGVLESNEHVEIHLLTRPAFFPFFKGISRLHLVEAHIHDRHKGIRGLFRLYRELKRDVKPDLVLDVHKVLRTYVLDLFFRLGGHRVVWFDKGNKDKKRIIRTKVFRELPSTVERYAQVFVRNGYPVRFPASPVLQRGELPGNFWKVFAQAEHLLIGIAPFAKHRQKVWGKEKVDKLIELINQEYKSTVVLFGGGREEIEQLNQIASKYPNCIVSAGYFSLRDELNLLPRFHVMVSMDSANMHLAALAGVPTISVWGATHPAFGFTPYGQPAENIIQYEGDQLPCRPCSVFGNKKCIFADIRCMEYVPAEAVFKRIKQILTNRN
ncbi:MAG: glycosyltransferase family 9 protein [Prolixibacteraceae bacterium]